MKSTIQITKKGKIITFTAVLEKHLEAGMYYDEEKTLYIPKREYDAWNSKELSGDIQARERFIERLEKLDYPKFCYLRNYRLLTGTKSGQNRRKNIPRNRIQTGAIRQSERQTKEAPRTR